MYLSKLEIIGFKSFANKTIFNFTNGLSAIVGPNGCGKTNVVDAIRWVLGEQKSNILRSDVMENVIFNGTSNRKPLSLSEVSLTVHNNKNILPTEYTDVTISRRLFRNGDSQYLLNNSQCRLKDIIDLFMDTGMGSDSYSVIELKMVEAILSGKPEERRHLFEEAAGVTKYKLRRREASKKLLAVQGDLMRVEDIIQEIEKNVNSLSRQASKTKKYNKLFTQMKELECKIIKKDYFDLKIVYDNLHSELEQLNAVKTKMEADITEIEEQNNTLKENLTQLQDKYQLIIIRENAHNAAILNKQKDLAISKEKKSSLKSVAENTKKQITEAETTIEQHRIQTEKVQSKIKDNEILKSEIDENLKSKKIHLKEAQSELSYLREEANSSNEEAIGLTNKIISVKQNVKKNNLRIENLENLIEKNNLEIEKLQEQIQIAGEGEEQLIQKKSENTELLKVAEKELTDAQTLQETLKEQSELLQNKLNDDKLNLSRKTSQLEFLSTLIEGDDTTKFLLKNKEWTLDTEKYTLVELIETEDQYKVAVEAALGEAAKYIVVGKRQDAFNAMNILRSQDKGKAVFICKEFIKPLEAPKCDDISGNSLGFLSEMVEVEEPLRHILRALLGKTVLVEKIEDAVNLVDNFNIDVAVTLNGEMITSKSIIKGGSIAKKEGIIVGKVAKINKLKNEIDELNKIIFEEQTELSNLKQQLAKIDLNLLNGKIRQISNEINSLEQRITKFKYQKVSIENNLKLIEQNLQRQDEEIFQLNNENEKYESEIDDLEQHQAQIKEELQSKQNEVSLAEQHFNKISKDVQEEEIKSVKIETELRTYAGEIQRLESEIKQLSGKIVSLNSELERCINDDKTIDSQIEAFEREIEAAQAQSIDIKSEKEILFSQTKTVEEEFNTQQKDLNQRKRDGERLVSTLHSKDLQFSEANSTIKTLKQRAAEGYEMDLEKFENDVEQEFSLTSAKAELADLKDKLANIGSVNFLALEEFEAQNQRYNFYQTQVQDLKDSEKTLQETITEINITAEEKFLSTFTQIQQNFKDLFKKLFKKEGGEAELKLAEGNPLESDIEIIAKPPGKKPHSIEGLSSGEKTLTAIALLFAIYLVKPSPFCILDEVDAPLDDTNIDLFLNLIKEFSNNTQFLIVTHNKRTMEAADTLYGITMQEDGVSKVVSARLAQMEA